MILTALFQGGVNRGTQIRRSVANSIQIRQSVSNSLSNPSIRDYFCSNLHTPKFGESQKQTELTAASRIFRSDTGVRQTNKSETQFKTVLELWRKAGKAIMNYSDSVIRYICLQLLVLFKDL